MGKQKLNKKRKIVTIISSVLCFVFLFSVSTYALEEPVKPTQNNFTSNAEIDNYNSQVIDYNQQVDKYNKDVDVEYENEVSLVNEQNAEINAHNEAEEQRFNEQTAYNEQAIKDAEEQNSLIDEQNKAKEQEVNAINEERTKEYEEALEQYNKDKIMEDKILALGYKSVEDYNNHINNAYNNPANLSVEKNASADSISVKNTYVIEEAITKSGKIIKVSLEHLFVDNNVLYSEEFEIDANDTITFLSIGALAETTSPGYSSFYYNMDNYKMGYWFESYSYSATAAKIMEYGWNCGDTHTISFKNGKLHSSDPEDIIMHYEYMWNPLRTYKTYNTPVEPTLELEEFVPIEYVTPELIEVLPKDIWDKLPSPTKKQYLTYIALIPRLAEPTSTTIVESGLPTPTVTPTNPTTGPIILTDLSLIDTSNAGKDGVEIKTMELPLSNVSGNWALINLITVLINFVLAIILFITWLHNHHKEDNDGTIEVKHRTPLRVLSLFITLGSIILFMLTENVRLPMVYVDTWTLPMIIIMLVQIIVMIISKHKEKEIEENS